MYLNMDIVNIDLLIVGGGLAGLSAAVEASSKKLKVGIVYNGPGASPGIMGFNSPLMKDDSKESFKKDIMESGCYINNQKLVEILVNESKEIVKDLEKLGLNFDKDENDYNLLQALSCSYPRVIHYRNNTGVTAIRIMKKILYKNNVLILKNVNIFRLLEDNNKIVGALGFDEKSQKIILFNTGTIILATGGCCNIYSFNSNTFDTNGDGYAMAYNTGAELMDMEFIQFEPCCAVYPKSIRGRGMITTLLNKGGTIHNTDNERFMLNYSENGESVHKDILARCINLEIVKGKGTENGGVYFDVSDVPDEIIKNDYPLYLKRYLAVGIDIRKTPIEVAPAAHTSIGGIKIDEFCRGSVGGLFACGEVVGGIHGANRIGGNAGTEVFVFGKRAGVYSSEYSLKNKKNQYSDEKIIGKIKEFFKVKNINVDGIETGELNEKKEKTREILSKNAGVVREGDSIKKGIKELLMLKEEAQQINTFNNMLHLINYYKMLNIMTVSEMVLRSALVRTESRGVHFRKDFPEKDDSKWIKNIIIKKTGRKMMVSKEKVAN